MLLRSLQLWSLRVDMNGDQCESFDGCCDSDRSCSEDGLLSSQNMHIHLPHKDEALRKDMYCLRSHSSPIPAPQPLWQHHSRNHRSVHYKKRFVFTCAADAIVLTCSPFAVAHLAKRVPHSNFSRLLRILCSQSHSIASVFANVSVRMVVMMMMQRAAV